MEKFKYYKQLVGAIILAGIMAIVALRIGDIANAIDAVLSAFVPPLILGGLHGIRAGYSCRSLRMLAVA
nr:hypothetical protein [Veillonella denticariosi]